MIILNKKYFKPINSILYIYRKEKPWLMDAKREVGLTLVEAVVTLFLELPRRLIFCTNKCTIFALKHTIIKA